MIVCPYVEILTEVYWCNLYYKFCDIGCYINRLESEVIEND